MSGPIRGWLRETFGWLALLLWGLTFFTLFDAVADGCPKPLRDVLEGSDCYGSTGRVARGIGLFLGAVLASFAYVVALLRRP